MRRTHEHAPRSKLLGDDLQGLQGTLVAVSQPLQTSAPVLSLAVNHTSLCGSEGRTDRITECGLKRQRVEEEPNVETEERNEREVEGLSIGCGIRVH